MRRATSAWLALRGRRIPGEHRGVIARTLIKEEHPPWRRCMGRIPVESSAYAMFHGYLLSAQSAIHAPVSSVTPGLQCISIAALLYEEVTVLSRGLGRLEAESCNLCTGLAAVKQRSATTWIKAYGGTPPSK